MVVDVVRWLRGLGLEQYASAFADNHIDGSILPELTAEDLLALGVASVGHRRRLLSAIASLGDKPPVAAPLITEAGSSGEAERRQLTLMFCDLVGSTSLASRIDPEDLRDVIAAYHRTVAKTVERFNGLVAKYMGDGALIYFGYPQAHEDDAERAVRAGLALLDAVGRLPGPEPLQAHIGIATGLVVVGDLIGKGAAQERGVVGETPNLAARLEGLAAPGTLVIADSTRSQLGSLFKLEDLGVRPLAGFAEPQRCWRVTGESGAPSRFEALRSDTTPLVGRDEDLEMMLRRWHQAKAGEGRVVLLSGEPGIGKSRLMAALSEKIRGTPHTRLRWFCSPYHQDSALYPPIAQLEQAAGFTRDDSPGDKLTKARDVLSPGGPADDDFELLAELLSLPNAAADLNLSAPRKREKLFEALLRQLSELARTDPVLAIFEDTHWIDPTSRELIDLMIERVQALPVLLIITFRPEFQAPWGGQPHVTNLALNRLGGRDVAAMIRGIAGNLALGSEVVGEIVERTDGVPLFVEELTKAVLEQAGQENRIATVLSASPVPGLAVPATLHASLVARLDRIGVAAREVAQIGAVLGRDFSYELIEPVAQRPVAPLRAALVQLDDAGLLFCRGVPPQSSYRFKHALVQDAAYGTLLRTRRQELHARVATVLEQDFADLIERQPELLAHHLTAAANTERAVEQWLIAGLRASGHLAHVEGIAHLRRGLALLASLPETATRDAREIDLQLALGLSTLTVNGMGSQETANAYTRARQLADRHGDDRQMFQALFGSWIINSGTGGIQAARPYMERLAQVADRSGDEELRLQAHHSVWTTLCFGGEPMEAHAHTEAGRRLYDAEQYQSHRHIYGGHDPGVCACRTGGLTEWLLGYPTRAQTSMSEALALAQQIGHPFSYEIALEFAALVHLDRGEPELALEQLVAAEALRAEQRISSVFGPAVLFGAVEFGRGEIAEAIIHLCEGLAQAQTAGALGRPYGHCLLAQALMRQGRQDDALATLSEAFERIEATGERGWESELHRVKGLVLLAQGLPAEGQASLEQAVQIARQQQAKSLELRAATSLGLLWGEQSRRAEAVNLLAPVYSWFTEGLDTADLKQAKTLLDDLT
jgi:class 3 adenylate cyclase/tetratricopeptide (TPR) repeat protein